MHVSHAQYEKNALDLSQEPSYPEAALPTRERLGDDVVVAVCAQPVSMDRHAILVTLGRCPQGGMGMTSGSHGRRTWSRRAFLQHTLGGVAAGAIWRGWPSRQLAMAQKGTPTGQMTWALHITLAPTWFDPAETGALITP